MERQSRLDLLQGTLDLLILRTLQTGPMHGWAISERIQQISRDVLPSEPRLTLSSAAPT
jgi:DNA-binding PadR family transcriptional regulator